MAKQAIMSNKKCPHCGNNHSSEKSIKNCKKVMARKKGKGGKRK